MSANAHETRDSISVISYAGCLGLLSPVTRAKIYSKCVPQPEIAKKSLKTRIFGVQGRSSSSMLVPLESSSAKDGRYGHVARLSLRRSANN